MRSRFFTGLWAHPEFARLWAGESISTFGSLIGGLALSFTAILFLDASAPEVAILAAAQLVPGFLISPFAGVWVDRLPRRPIMIAADIGRAIALFTVPIAAVVGLLTIWQLYVVALATSTLGVFFSAAYRAYLPTIVESHQLVEGNAKLSGTASVIEVASFSISGWLVQLLRAPGAVAVDAVSFLFSAFFIWRIKTPEVVPARNRKEARFWHEARDGAQVVLSDGVLRSLAIANAIQALAEKVLTVVFLLYLGDELGFSPGVLGMIFAIGGVASVFGAYLANRGTLFFGSLGATMVTSSALRATGALFMPLCVSNDWVGIAFLVANQVFTDPFWSLFEIHDISLRQAITPERFQGRMFANFRLIEFGFAIVGTAVGGILGSLIGPRETLFVAVGLMYVSALVLALSPAARIKKMPIVVRDEQTA